MLSSIIPFTIVHCVSVSPLNRITIDNGSLDKVYCDSQAYTEASITQ